MKKLLLLGVAVFAAATSSAEPVLVYAAGSLRAPLTEAAHDFERQQHAPIRFVFGASGLLRDRIRAGEPAQVFASANMEHPQSLAGAGWGATQTFARNALCALARSEVPLSAATLVRTLLDPAVKLGTSTPKADPSGDYAFEMFERIGRSPGAPAQAQVRLAAKALQLTGGPDSPPPPAGRNVYGALVASRQADVFITYCTNAVIAVREEPGLHWLEIPPQFNVAADYGLAVRDGAPAAARAFVEYLRSGPGQQILQRHGFALPP